MKHLSKSLEETAGIARNFLDSLEKGERAMVVGLYGDLGSGKTAFAQEVGKLLGVEENMHSPTFVIMKIYRITNQESTAKTGQARIKNLIHIDAYRLEKKSELLHLGWEEIIREPENLILIEWPENVAGLIPKDAKKINFKFIDENTREIKSTAKAGQA